MPQVTMTAEFMHPVRVPRWRSPRAWPTLVAVAACVLVAACGNDERATLSPAADASAHQAAPAPLAQSVAPAQSIAILASPSQPLKQANASTSPAPPLAPLAPPVIHTVE
jgi:hypothetical protein